MEDCKNESLLAMSGRVLTAAYWRLPITPLRASRSDSVTFWSGWSFRSLGMLMDLICLM
jgi:hypothetical protein